jgi:hypothetical protein
MSDETHQTGKDYERIARNINPGGWAIENEQPISTLLGSCVAVCLYDPKLKLGGMNHFLLPSSTTANNSDVDVILNGDYSMEVLVNGLLNKGAQKARLVAKAFGGGTIISSINMDMAGAIPHSPKNGWNARTSRLSRLISTALGRARLFLFLRTATHSAVATQPRKQVLRLW